MYIVRQIKGKDKEKRSTKGDKIWNYLELMYQNTRVQSTGAR